MQKKDNTSMDMSLYKPGSISVRDLDLCSTSGTTGVPRLLIKERPYNQENKDFDALIFLSNNRNRIVHENRRFQRDYHRMKRLLYLTINDMEREELCTILKEFQPTQIYGTWSMILKMTEVIGQEETSGILNNVSHITFSGELVPRSICRYLQSIFTEVSITISLGLSEIGNIGLSCPYIVDFHHDPDRDHTPIHPQKDCTAEIEDPNKEGVGNMIIERAGKRKRTGDMAKIINEPCPCGKQPTVLVYGRYDFDILHCAGTTILSAALKKIFDRLKDYVEDYLVEADEKTRDEKMFGHLSFMIVPTKKLHTMNLESFMQEQVFSKLQLTNTRTLADLVRDNVFLPSDIILVSKIPRRGKNIHLRKTGYQRN